MPRKPKDKETDREYELKSLRALDKAIKAINQAEVCKRKAEYIRVEGSTHPSKRKTAKIKKGGSRKNERKR